MSETALLAAARSAVVAFLPSDVSDKSDRPEDVTPKSLPAFVVDLERLSAERASMGSNTEDVELELSVEVFRQYETAADPRADMLTEVTGLSDSIRADTSITALVDDILSPTVDVDLARGDKRLARGMITFSIKMEI